MLIVLSLYKHNLRKGLDSEAENYAGEKISNLTASAQQIQFEMEKSNDPPLITTRDAFASRE